MVQSALFSSASDLWGTPPEVYRLLDEVYDFQLDAAATRQNALCENHFTLEDDSLSQDWHPYRRIWLNPPYGRTISAWMQKAFEESQKGCLVVCLVPARVDTKWWHNWVQDKARVTFFKGRLRYLDYTNAKSARSEGARAGGAPFPSAIVVYEPHLENRIHFSSDPVVRPCEPVKSRSK